MKSWAASKGGRRRSQVALLLAVVWTLTPAKQPFASTMPSLAAINHLESDGTREVEVLIPADVRLWFDPSHSAQLSSTGRFAALVIEQLMPDPMILGNVMLFMKAFPPQGCTVLRCANLEENLPMSYQGTGEPYPDEEYMDFPAGPYRISMIADGQHHASAILTLEGLQGETTVEVTEPTDRVLGVRTEDDRDPQTQVPSLLQGGATGILPAPGVSILYSWYVADGVVFLGSSSCIGHPDSDVFDDAGHCRPEKYWNHGEEVRIAGGLRTGRGLICWSTRSECPPGSLRMAYRFDEGAAVDSSAGGLGLWISLTGMR